MQFMENHPIVDSYHFGGEFSSNCVELGKKRKLQYELVNPDIPWPKHQFRDRSSTSGFKSLNSECSEAEKNHLNKFTYEEIYYGMDQPIESDDSNSCIEEDTILATQFEAENASSQASNENQPSNSINNSNNNVFRDNIYSSDSRTLKEVIYLQHADLEGTPQYRHLYEDVGHPGLKTRRDYITSEFGKDSIGFANFDAENMMLDSNDVAPNSLLLSSDSRSGSKKPTIDQEFEEYFSMLML